MCRCVKYLGKTETGRNAFYFEMKSASSGFVYFFLDPVIDMFLLKNNHSYQ